jgi:hypothetical protein
MARIVAARLEQAANTKDIVEALSSQGFKRSEFQTFYVNPEGQHARFPIGGDAYSDEGAKRAGQGALRGSVIGGLVGLVAGAGGALLLDNTIVLLAATAVGAYVGSLVGTLSRLRGGDKRRATVRHPIERPPGQMVAVRVDNPAAEQRAIAILTRHGARDIERAEGTWQAGDWKDFDPRIPAGR